MAAPPICAKCGKDHFRFVRCSDVVEWNKRHGATQARIEPRIENWSVPPGHRLWGDRVSTWDVRGNVYWRRNTDEPTQAA